MTKRLVYVVVPVMAVIVAMVALNAVIAPVSAAEQLGAPAAAPRQESTAEWVVDSMTFESEYPEGFTFRAAVSSSAGEIVSAKLKWYRPSLRATDVLSVYAEDVTFDEASGVYSASWRADRLQMVPPWVQIRYHWEFRDAAGNEFRTEPALAEYEDATRAWTRSESADAIVFTSDLSGDIEETVLDAMAQQHDHYVAVWGAPLPNKPRIVLFGDYDAWLEWRTADNSVSDTQVVVGQTYDEWGTIVQVLFVNDSYDDLAYGTVVHEIEHLYQNEFLATRDRRDVPGWFFEGDATFAELLPSYDYEAKVRGYAADGILPPLLVNPADAPRVDGENPRWGYDIGYTFFVWMRETTGGLDAHAEVMRLLAADVPFFQALEEALGMTQAEIEQSWRTWLGASAFAPTLVPTWTPPAIPMIVTPAGK